MWAIVELTKLIGDIQNRDLAWVEGDLRRLRGDIRHHLKLKDNCPKCQGRGLCPGSPMLHPAIGQIPCDVICSACSGTGQDPKEELNQKETLL